MRPVKLTMEAFGSYGKRTVIDFDVPDQNIFLITGDTGAGKSTIFDAIVFALYGEASSSNNKKDGMELQSQYAGLDKEPFVILDFVETYGGETKEYSVRREPQHLRAAKRKGAKDQAVSEKVSLTMPDGTEYPQKEADRKLEEIVGLTKDQFMQVAMIAQGEFMELLRNKTSNKKEIFRKLFDTDVYKRIIDELGVRIKEKNADIGRIKTICKQEVSHIVVPEDYEGAELLSEKKNNIEKSDRLNTAEMESLLELLSALCKEYETKTEQLKETEKKAEEDRDEKRDAFTKADGLLRVYKSLEEAQIELAKCEEEEPLIEESKKLAKVIESAFEIKQVYQRVEDARKTVEEDRKNLDDNKEKLPNIEESLNAAKNKAEESKKTADEKLGAFSTIKEKVEKAISAFDEIENSEKIAEDKKSEFDKSIQDRDNCDTQLKELLEKEQEWKQQSEELKDAAAILEKWKSKKQNADNLVEEVSDVRNSESEVNSQKTKIKNAEAKVAEAIELFERKNDEYNSEYRAFWDEQAGVIARDLKEGEPCPVCGSLSHPSPAQMSEEHAHLDMDALEEMKKEVDNLRTKHEESIRSKQSAEERLEEKNKNLSEKLDKLKDRIVQNIGEIQGEFSIDTAENTIKAWQKSVDEQGVLLNNNVEKFNELRGFLNDAEDKEKDLREKFDEFSKNTNKLKEEHSKVIERINVLKDSVQYSDREEALKEKEKAEQESTDAKVIYEKAQKDLDVAKKQRDATVALIKKYENDLPAEEEELNKRNDEYTLIMTDKKLTESEWKDITSKHEKSEVEDQRIKIADHEKKLSAAKRAISEARTNIADHKKPDTEALRAAFEKADEHYRKIKQETGIVEDCYKANKGVYDELAPKMNERASIMEEHDRIESLHNRLAGKVSGARMDIETFVQRYYLERILHAANRRFRDMSAGQFELRMVGYDRAGEGKNRGLDLMVYSEVTGKEREVRTLSGGESFMAALSLALGMADQIQESSAAIGLDMMFIDEGFGSLDDHSRSQAVKVLKQMAGGTKLIGIISHVSELKQEIEDQLYVSKNDDGSHVRWID